MSLLAMLAAFGVPAAAGTSENPGAGEAPDAAAAVAAYMRAREWVTAFQTPPQNDDASRLKLEGCRGVCVILRQAGRVMGVGVDTSGDELMLRRAVGGAMNDVLSDPAYQRLAAAIANRDGKRKKDRNDGAAESRPAASEPEQETGGLTIDAIRASLGQSLTLEIEVAGDPAPVVGKNMPSILAKVEPGIDGMAMRRGTSWHASFPAQARITNASGDPRRQLLNLALNAGFALKDFDNLPQQNDVAIYTFRSIDLAELQRGKAPSLLVMGDVPVAASSMDHDGIARLAEGIARHLLACRFPKDSIQSEPGAAPAAAAANRPLGLMGSYRVIADEHEPMIAPPLEQALAAWALAAFSHSKADDEALRAAAGQAAGNLLRDLHEIADDELDWHADPAACAAIVHAVAASPELRGDADIAALFREACAVVTSSFDPKAGFAATPADGKTKATTPPPHVQAMLAGAMARLVHMRGEGAPEISPTLARGAADAAWASVPEPKRVALLPWIGWAEQDLADASGDAIGHLDDLRRLAEALHRTRFADGGREARPEFLGGLVLAGEADSPASKPTSQTIRPAAWLATALRNPQITPPDTAAQARTELRGTMRFLAQLSIRDGLAGLVRNPAKAVGGLRNSLWDSDLAVPAQALGLVTAVEALASLDQTGEHGEAKAVQP